MKVKDIPRIQRPREKFERYGVNKMTDHELLSLILGSGIKGVNVMQLSKRILSKISKEEPDLVLLTSIKGLGKSKSMQILAALEIGKRMHKKEPAVIVSPSKVFEMCADIRSSRKEHLVVFYMNSGSKLISREVVSIGTLNESLLHPREVFEPAIRHSAAKILIAHNHPSGDVMPSPEDLVVTKRIRAAGELLGIELVDHIILTKGQYLSFRSQKLLS